MQKVVFVSDPGIDGAVALTLAMLDRELDVLGLAATAGNVSAEQATKNVHILVEQLDPVRWPRLGHAVPVVYDIDGTKLHGLSGLGGTNLPCARLHNRVPSDKLIVEILRQYPGEVTVVCLGPMTALATAMDRDSDFNNLVKRVICVGGSIAEPGNAGPVSEFHFFCDPASARQVIESGTPLTLIPLDVTRKVLLAPMELRSLPNNRAGKLLSQIIPAGINATANLFGIEGFQLEDVLGLAAVAIPEALLTQPMTMDVEVKGELTRGMTVFDRRTWRNAATNVDVAVEVDVEGVKDYMRRTLEAST